MVKKLKLAKTTTYTQCPQCNSLFIVPFDRRQIFGNRVVCSADGCNKVFIAEHAEANGKRINKRGLSLYSEYEKDHARMNYPFGILPEDFFKIIQTDDVPSSIAKAIRQAGINKASLSITEEGVIELIQAITKNPVVTYAPYVSIEDLRLEYEKRKNDNVE